MITNINVGICHRRITESKAPFFVNWIEDGINKYFFSQFRFAVENKKNELLKKSNNQNHNS